MIILLLIPSLLLLVIVFVLPLFRYLWLSFHADSVVTGLIPIPNHGANWVRLISDERYWQAIGQTFRLPGFLFVLNWYWHFVSLFFWIRDGEVEVLCGQ